jgi:uncharacterized damage-inducible protein DinB
MRRLLILCLLVTLVTAPAALAQEPPAAAPAPQTNPLSGYSQGVYSVVQQILLRAADKVPEENYGFQPAETVRSFGQIVGHIADSQYIFCSLVLGETNPRPNVERTKTAKADLIAALKDAFAYCDRAYGSLTDQTAAETVKLFGDDTPKLGTLMINHMHNLLHYGNLVTYMRMQDIVPPTSEPGFHP